MEVIIPYNPNAALPEKGSEDSNWFDKYVLKTPTYWLSARLGRDTVELDGHGLSECL